MQIDYSGKDRDTEIQTVILIDYRDTDRDIATHIDRSQKNRQRYETYIDRSQINRQRYRHTDNYICRQITVVKTGYRNTDSYIDRLQRYRQRYSNLYRQITDIQTEIQTYRQLYRQITGVMMLIQETNLKITGPTGIFWENRDYKTIIMEPFANDFAHMVDE